MNTKTIVGAALLAVASSGVVRAELVYGLSQNTLYTFDSANPSFVSGARPITGLGNETLVGIDIRPATGQLFGLSAEQRLFTIDPTSGVASSVGSGRFATATGSSFGFDFNPVPDAIRIVSNDAENFRVSPSGSLLGTDGRLAYAVGDPSFGLDPNVSAVAYNNNFAGATTTRLFGIDSDRDAVVIIAPPNGGVLQTLGLLGVNATEDVTFDISGGTGSGFASLMGPGANLSQFYQIDLETGTATLIGTVGVLGGLDGIAVIPEPGTWAILLLGLGGLAARRRQMKK